MFALLFAFCPLTASAASAEHASPDTGKSAEHAAAHDGDHDEGDHHKDDHHEDGHDEDGHGEHGKKGHGGHGSRFSDEAIPLQIEGFPQRPKPLLELGEPFLGTGTLDPGFELPTGAVWQPSLLMFGNFRTAIQTFDSGRSGPSRTTEWANRLDLFFNLQLSGTERLVVGFRTFDEGGRFTSYFFEHPDQTLDGEFQDELDAEIETLFFEGDFGEIFPNVDRQDFGSTDIGFSVGRQPMLFQEGLLINDTIDGVGFTRNTLLPKGTSNFRMTFFYGWDNFSSRSGTESVEREANLYALLTSTDFRRSTVDIDVAYLDTGDLTGSLSDGTRLADGALLGFGISAVQRLGKTNSSVRLLGSRAVDEETPFSTDGWLLFSELSWTPKHSHDLLYVNTFWAIDEYSAIALGPAMGGPLGRAGVNFASVGLGSFQAPLAGAAHDVAGGAIGYQKFFDHNRQQLLFEVGGRVGTSSAVADAYAATLRYQRALGRRFVVITDGFSSRLTSSTPATDDQTLWGGRLELTIKF